MKNTLTINANDNFILECLDSVNDGTNGLYLHFIISAAFTVSYAGHGVQTITPDNNTVEIDQSWYLSSDLIFAVGDVIYTVLHPTTTTGEMMVQAVNDRVYQVSFKQAGGGGSNVSITPTLSEGMKIADYSIDGEPGELYAPEGGGGSYIDLVGTVNAGETSITLSNTAITLNSTFDLYTSVYGVVPKKINLSEGNITLLFDALNYNFDAKVRVY